MDDDSTTANADNQDDSAKNNQPDPNKTATDSGTDTNKTGADNSDETSKSTDESAGGDKSTTDTKEDKSSAPKFDTDLDEWAKKTNRAVPTTDRERELYQEIRNGQREFSREKQAKDVSKNVDTAIAKAEPVDNKTDDDDDERDPVEKRQDALEAKLAESEAKRLRSEFFTEKSVDQKTSDVMGEILQEKVDKAKTPAAKKAAFDYWTNPDNLEDWHALAKARLATTQDTTVIEEEAARKERERIAKESQANGTGRNANNGQAKPKTGYDRNAFLKSDD
jgi:hypothetical protein